jgi:putative transposase
MKDWGFLADSRYLLHDRDGKFCPVFREVMQAGKVKPLKLPARSLNLNAFAERWVGSVKEECLSRLIFFGEQSLRRALTEYIGHFHGERNHQGKGNNFCSPHHADRSRAAAGKVCNAKNDSVAYCDTTRPEQHEYWLGLLF